MKIPKELNEKLRKFLSLCENPLSSLHQEMSLWDKELDYSDLEREVVGSLQLRQEIIDMLDSQPVKGKYKQMDIEQEIIRIKSPHENY